MTAGGEGGRVVEASHPSAVGAMPLRVVEASPRSFTEPGPRDSSLALPGCGPGPRRRELLVSRSTPHRFVLAEPVQPRLLLGLEPSNPSALKERVVREELGRRTKQRRLSFLRRGRDLSPILRGRGEGAKADLTPEPHLGVEPRTHSELRSSQPSTYSPNTRRKIVSTCFRW